MVKFPKTDDYYKGNSYVYLIVYQDNLKSYSNYLEDLSKKYDFIPSAVHLNRIGQEIVEEVKGKDLDDFIDSKYLEEVLFPPLEEGGSNSIDEENFLKEMGIDSSEYDFIGIESFGGSEEDISVSIPLISSVFMGMSDKVYGKWVCEYKDLKDSGKLIYDTFKSEYGEEYKVKLLTFIG